MITGTVSDFVSTITDQETKRVSEVLAMSQAIGFELTYSEAYQLVKKAEKRGHLLPDGSLKPGDKGITQESLLEAPEQYRKVVRLYEDMLAAVAALIMHVGRIHASALFGVMATAGLPREEYKEVVTALERVGLVKEDTFNVIHWTGPRISPIPATDGTVGRA